MTSRPGSGPPLRLLMRTGAGYGLAKLTLEDTDERGVAGDSGARTERRTN